MILLDTNVVSEAMRPEPNPRVLDWLNTQPTGTLYLPSVALAELLFGIVALPDGHRKERLARALEGLMALFAGRGLSTADGYIAAIAACRGCEVASRDVSPYRAVGLTVIDPWATPPETS